MIKILTFSNFLYYKKLLTGLNPLSFRFQKELGISGQKSEMGIQIGDQKSV